MAEGLINALYGDEYEAFGAGLEPASVHPLAIEVMKEIGIDISAHRSKGIDEFIDEDFDYVVTVCDRANEACPYFPKGTVRLHRGFEDPASIGGSENERLVAFRRVRNQIQAWLRGAFSLILVERNNVDSR